MVEEPRLTDSEVRRIDQSPWHSQCETTTPAPDSFGARVIQGLKVLDPGIEFGGEFRLEDVSVKVSPENAKTGRVQPSPRWSVSWSPGPRQQVVSEAMGLSGATAVANPTGVGIIGQVRAKTAGWQVMSLDEAAQAYQDLRGDRTETARSRLYGRSEKVMVGESRILTESSGNAFGPATQSDEQMTELFMGGTRRVTRIMPDGVQAFDQPLKEEVGMAPDESRAHLPNQVRHEIFDTIATKAASALSRQKQDVRFQIRTRGGDIVRVRMTIVSNLVRARISVSSSELHEVLATYSWELNQRLEMQGLVADDVKFFLLGDRSDDSERRQRRSNHNFTPQETILEEESVMLVESVSGGFDRWA